MRALVDGFGDYASDPQLERKPLLLDELIRDVVALYQYGQEQVRFHLDLSNGPPGLTADSQRETLIPAHLADVQVETSGTA